MNADLIAAQRDYCAASLANFARMAWPILEPATPRKWGWALDLKCAHLEAVTAGEIKRLLINEPPGCMKSLITSVIWPAWEWGPKGLPSKRFLSTAHKQDLAVRDSTKCRRLIQSAWYQALWPVVLTSDQNAKTKFENDSTGSRASMAFESMTGERGDRVILDDPHSVDDANSRQKLASAVLTFREALPSRVNNEHSAIVIIMQRLAVGDVSDVALELGYEHLCLPMRYEPGRSKWAVGVGDPRKIDGELLFPERFADGMVTELEKSLGSHAAAGQLQQRPSPRGGNIIKGEWFQRYTVLPKLRHLKIYADTAQKTSEQHDFSVFECWGLGEDGKIYLVDLIRGKWTAPELKNRALAFWAKHLPTGQFDAPLQKMMVEDKSSGTGLIQDIRQSGSIPIEGIQRVRDKLTRVLDVVSYIESGLVCLPQVAPWVTDFVGECEAFTASDTHPHDDQIDPMCDAITDLLATTKTVYDYL